MPTLKFIGYLGRGLNSSELRHGLEVEIKSQNLSSYSITAMKGLGKKTSVVST